MKKSLLSAVALTALVAFSGTVTDPETGLDYTEPGMNTDVVTAVSVGSGTTGSVGGVVVAVITVLRARRQTGGE